MYKLEEKGHIEQLPNGGKKLYAVTDSGKKELENFLIEINEVRDFIADLIKININKREIYRNEASSLF